MCDLSADCTGMRKIKTDASAKAAKADGTKQIEYRVEGVRGLALRVSPVGVKTWTMRYRNRDGEQRRHTLGTYPEVGLADARMAAERALGEVAGGRRPGKGAPGLQGRSTRSEAIHRQ